MNPVRKALFERLAGDATLTGLLGTVSSGVNIWHRVAPRETPEPFVILDKQSGVDEYTIASRAYTEELWLVKAIDRRQSGSRAEDVAARIDVVLNDAPLVLTSGAVLYCRRVSAVDYGEQDGADTFQHVGGIYRLVTIP